MKPVIVDPPGGFEEAPPESFSGTLGAKVVTVLFGLILAALALFYAFILVQGLQAAFQPDGDAAQALEDGASSITTGALWAESASNLVVFGLLPVAWVVFTRLKPRLGTAIYLRLHEIDWRRDLTRGLGLGLALWLSVIVISVLRLLITGDMDQLTSDNGTADSPLIEAFGRVITWPLALFMALVAGVAEEIFFRGVLQRWIGIWGQAVVFGLTHASYGTVDQIVFPFLLGLVFGWLIKRGHSLVLVIVAHFTFNFVQFALLLSAS